MLPVFGCVRGSLDRNRLRRPLFRGASTYGQLELIVSYTGTPADEVIARVPNTAAREFLRQRQRPSADSASMFPSLAEDGQSVLRGLLTFEPSKRIDAASSLLSPFFRSIHCSKEYGRCTAVTLYSTDAIEELRGRRARLRSERGLRSAMSA